MAKKVGLIIAIVALAALGGLLVSGCGADDRSVWWYQQHLETVQQQLNAIKTQLLKYKTDHGHYPTDDEGLAALDGFRPHFPAILVRQGLSDYYIWSPRMYADIKQRLVAYKNQKGRFPGNAEELLDATRLNAKSKIAEDDRLFTSETTHAELTIGPEGDLFFTGPAGVLTFWKTPYVYENRQGLAASLFDSSPASANADSRYCTQVDDGVFVYSTGARDYASKRDTEWWVYNGPRLFGGGLLVAALTLLVLLIRVSWKAGIVGAIALVLSGGYTWYVGGRSYTTCYIMSPTFSQRTPEMVSQQRELLDKYHARGILGDEAYKKAMAALEDGQPDSQR